LRSTRSIASLPMRVASRQDINRLTRALGRTEDKLEQVLQEVEELRDEIGSSTNGTARSRSGGGSGSGRGGAANSRKRTPRRSSGSS
jgi:hypothetical protein